MTREFQAAYMKLVLQLQVDKQSNKLEDAQQIPSKWSVHDFNEISTWSILLMVAILHKFRWQDLQYLKVPSRGILYQLGGSSTWRIPTTINLEDPNYHQLGGSQLPSTWRIPATINLEDPNYHQLGGSQLPSTWRIPTTINLEDPSYHQLGGSQLPSTWRIPTTINLEDPNYHQLGGSQLPSTWRIPTTINLKDHPRTSKWSNNPFVIVTSPLRIVGCGVPLPFMAKLHGL